MSKNNFTEFIFNSSASFCEANRRRDYVGEIMPNWHLVRFDHEFYKKPVPVRYLDGVFLSDEDYALVYSEEYYYEVQRENGTKPSLCFTMQPLSSDAEIYGASVTYEEMYSLRLQHYAARLSEMNDLDKLIESCIKEGFASDPSNLMNLSRWMSDRFYDACFI